MSGIHAALLALHAASESIQKSHVALKDAGHYEIATIVHVAGSMIATCIGRLVKAEMQRDRVPS